MEKITLGKTGLNISKIFYGGIISMKDGQEFSDKYVDYAIKSGVNYFDVAPSYGDAEVILGNSLIPYRKDIYIACKTTCRDAENAKREMEQSLKHLHTDYFDNYQLHSITTKEDVDKVFSKGGAFEVILKAKEEGIIKHLGITCHSEEAAMHAINTYDFETMLFPINWGLLMHKGFGKNAIALAQEKGMGILGMKGLVERAWEENEDRSMYPKSWCKPIYPDEKDFRIAALKYSLKSGAMSLVMPGTFECFEFAIENLDKILEPITDADTALLEAKANEINGRYFF